MVLASLCIRHFQKIIKGQQRLLSGPKGQYKIGQCKVNMSYKIGRTNFQIQFQQNLNQRLSSIFIISLRGVVGACLTFKPIVKGSNPTVCNHFFCLKSLFQCFLLNFFVLFFDLDFLSQSLPTTFRYQNVHNKVLHEPKGSTFAPICAILLGRMLTKHIYLKKVAKWAKRTIIPHFKVS